MHQSSVERAKGRVVKQYAAAVTAGLVALTCVIASADAQDVMAKLTALEGEWILLDENGTSTGVVGAVFKATANGSAVSEVMMPGGDHEMLNVYHADGDRVLMTHYCAAGNQPRLEIVPAGENRLELRFESITNLAHDGANHMHQADFQLRGPDRLTTYWYSMKDGKLSEEATVIDLARKSQ